MCITMHIYIYIYIMDGFARLNFSLYCFLLGLTHLEHKKTTCAKIQVHMFYCFQEIAIGESMSSIWQL